MDTKGTPPKDIQRIESMLIKILDEKIKSINKYADRARYARELGYFEIGALYDQFRADEEKHRDILIKQIEELENLKQVNWNDLLNEIEAQK